MPNYRFDRYVVTTLLTVVITAVWIISAVVRIWIEWPEAAILDSAMPVIVGYWFVTSAIKRNGATA